MSLRHFTVLAIICSMAFPVSVISIYSVLDAHIPHDGAVLTNAGVTRSVITSGGDTTAVLSSNQP